jgi:hypothetical protein
VTTTGAKTDATFEMASTHESVSAVTVAGQKAEAVPWEMASTAESVSLVTVTPSRTEAAPWEMSAAAESASSVTITPSAAHQTLAMSATQESVS